ncbi:MAG: hypothetical protein RSD57_16975 [Comamonas sp.]
MPVLLAAVPHPGGVLGVPPARFRPGGLLEKPGRLQQDYRYSKSTLGVIRDRVMLKASATAPEVPLRNARVWVQRLVDGYKAWEGFSDALGYYKATGLEVGVTYVITGIDTSGEHKSTAAGPVVAQKVTP